MVLDNEILCSPEDGVLLRNHDRSRETKDVTLQTTLVKRSRRPEKSQATLAVIYTFRKILKQGYSNSIHLEN